MKDRFETISQSLLFKGLPENYLTKIESIAITKTFEKGETIFKEGDGASGFYIIQNGMVKIFKVSLSGKEQILQIFGSREPFGEVPVFSGQHFPATAEALAKSTLLYFPRTSFVNLITASPSLSLNMLAILSLRLRQFTVQIETLSLKEVPGRLASYLIYLKEEQGGKNSVNLPISKGQLASLLGTVPETLSRIISNMKSGGLIEVKGSVIKLLDQVGLEALAEYGK